ncbi:hypothetical protein So717_37400 [Roseobacter cerasinus]|uniref:Type IV pilus biogenesis n=1 Tax=Roseobacter cerasinus TaxID=2602289 RepID=A0A640VVV1_9RHOB|nr:hypothetical protein [Roseobacter cerasinus]GFE51987.1 hypothetical protein So717_37400 [Roseobacter cerasinus]
MKPNFALSLSFESICLLHRVPAGWCKVGEVSPEDPDLVDRLAVLRRTGCALAPEGLRCKLVIPNPQIRYLRIDTPGLTPAEARDAARDALSGATPYPVDDLAFDISQQGDVTQVAAVALETLQEAEAFATQHAFHAVSFVARPDQDNYVGEPYFGPTHAARSLLDAGQTVEPDADAIVIVEAGSRPQMAEEQPAPQPVEAPAPTFRSTRAVDPQIPPRTARGDVPPIIGVADPSLPPRDVAPGPAFASRRADPPAPPRVYKTPPAPAWSGFAEQAEPFVHKPKPPRPERAGLSAPSPKTPKVNTETERMTVFGARGPDGDQPRGFRLPLGLTAVLVLILAGLGAASFDTLSETFAKWTGQDDPSEKEIVAVEVAPPVTQTDDVELERAPTAPQPALSDEDTAVLDALREIQTADGAAETEADQRTSYAATGIWPQAPAVPSPPPLVDIEDLYVTSIDPIEPAFDAVALPDVATLTPDTVFDAPSSPAAAGTSFALDPRGLVIASAAGTISPDGIPIFAGPPPARPASIPQRSATTTTAINPIETEFADVRPRPRPADLIETAERAALDGLTRDELAEFRPPIRPQIATAAAPARTASLVPLDDAPTQRIQASNPGLALAASLRPDARPSNFGQIVARAQRTAASAAAIGTASIAPVPPPRAVAPSIPSSASVAREATLRNAINLRNVNLIGVYGTPSSRRALVRLSNGRYKKVQVGDRIDGGRVSAIGEGELRYQKRGRNIVLKMPRS